MSGAGAGPVITAAPSPAILGETFGLTVRDVPDGVSAVVVRGGELAGGADHRYHLGEDLSRAGTWTGVVPLARDATVGEARLQVGIRACHDTDPRWFRYNHPVAAGRSWPEPESCQTTIVDLPGEPGREVVVITVVRAAAPLP